MGKKRIISSLLLLFSISALQGVDHVYLSEIMYDSPLNERVTIRPYSNGEYVRLYNAGTEEVGLQGWKLLGEGKTEMFVLPDVILLPQSSLVIAYRNSSSPSFELSTVFPSMTDTACAHIVYQDKVVLANTKEAIRLFDTKGILRDSIYYGNVTSIKPVSDRLIAENEDSIPGNECLSVQRRRIAHDPAGRAVASHLDWEVALVPEEGGGLPPIEMALVVPTTPSISSRINSIITRTALDGVSDMDHSGSARVLTTVQYYDGLGRPVQAVQVGASPTGADLVGLTEYDGWGRAYRQWLPTPVADNHGGYVPGIASTAKDFHGDTKPYEESILEQSPLNRVLGTKHPGYAFHEHPTGVEYGTNTSNEVKLLTAYDENGIQSEGYYDAGTLYKITRTDEDGNVVHEYTDLLGQVVLTRQMSDGMAHDTYYIYDDFGNLVCVVPPLLADHVGGTATYPFDGDTWMKDYAYCYRYDYRNRCVQKRLPGCEWIYQVYDKADRLVLTQDGNQRARGKWTSYKYDRFGRLVYTAEIVDDTPFGQLAGNFGGWLVVEEFSTQGHEHEQGDTGYSKNFYHQAETDLLTVNYYDNYDFLELLDGQTKSRLAYAAEDGYGEQYPDATGLLTGTRTYLLDGSGQYLATAYYYDNRGRVVQERSTNHMGGYDATYSQYDFIGNVTRQRIEHHAQDWGAFSLTEAYRHEYDHAGRPVRTWHQVDDNPEVLLTENTYDETGRLVTKEEHDGQNTVNYAYNIRNWPTAIEDGDFKESLFYCSNGMLSLFGATNLYNGNISSATYASGGKSYTYAYTYDGLNRLTAAKRQEQAQAVEVDGGLALVKDDGDAFSYNEVFSYDKQGNILTLQRNTRRNELNFPVLDRETGAILSTTRFTAHPVDNLSLEYEGNRLVAVTDEVEEEAVYNRKEYHDLNTNGNDFGYDANGNLIYDLDRDIVTIRYNKLNLPDTIQFRDGRQILNKYAADGTRLASTYYSPLHVTFEPLSIGETVNCGYYPPYLLDRVRTWFVGNKEYGLMEPTHYDYLELKRIYTPEGYVDKHDNYHYYRRDHLGNVREVWKATDSVALTVQRTRYYPSGLPWEYQAGDSASLQPYKFNSCEFIETHGYDMTDLGNRGVYHAINRFTSMDRFAEKYPWQSPYVHAGNNPVRFVDVNGDFPFETFWDIGNAIYDAGAAIVNHIKGDHQTAKSHWTDFGLDVASVFIPYVPAGASKAFKATDKVVDAIDNVNDVKKATGVAEESTKIERTDVYRVYGEDAKADGFSWTTENPNKVDNYRDKAGLPSGGESGANNSGQFVIEGSVDPRNIIEQRSALPLDGNKGGLHELIIDPKDVEIKRVSGANPPF